MRRSLRHPLAVVSSTVAIALLLTAPAEAQRKKPAPAPAAAAKKKPPAAPAPAKPKPDTAKPAPDTEETKPTKKAPVAEEEPESPKETKETEKEPERPSDRGGAKPIIADIGVGIRGFQRHLGYKEDYYGTLPSYDLSGAPEAVLALGVFPIKNGTGSITAGLVGSFGYAFALGSTYKVPPAGAAAGTKYTTKSMEFSVGAKANFIFGTSSLGVAAEFGSQTFKVDLPPPDAANAGVPDVAYTFIKPSLSARIGVADKISILASAGYLLVLGAGEIISPAYFPTAHASVGGVDASVGIGYEIAHHIEIRPALDFRRYFYKFSWSPASTITDKVQAPYPAGGAIDQYYGVSVMAGFRF
jgi:hypothetical protein